MSGVGFSHTIRSAVMACSEVPKIVVAVSVRMVELVGGAVFEPTVRQWLDGNGAIS
jgi:hypothetical protein